MMSSPADFDAETAKLAAEFVQRNSAQIADFGKRFLKGVSNKVKLRSPNTYKSYLTLASKKYGRAKSFFFRDEPTSIYDFYIPLGVSLGEEKLHQAKYADVVALTNRAIVTGAAGCGKSMLMRHFFLSAISDGSKVPVFVELRNYNQKDITLNSLIVNSLEEYGFDLGETYISQALEAGHFALILDGYDEIAYRRREFISRELQKLAQRSQNCTIMVSSRPDDIFSGWQEFSTLHINPLNVKEAADLIGRLPFDEDLKSKFLSDLQNSLFERHESFLSNPLLLSIMLLTYGTSADIPKKLSIFYNQAYEALFQRHDALKGGYQRDRRCDLDIQDFSRVFATFCVQTYDRRIFQFSRSDALGYIDKAKKAVSIEVSNENFLDDALQAVCLLVEDGLLIAFTHRSFQEYFTAKFVNESSPSRQRKLIDRFHAHLASDSVLYMLHEMNPDLVERELLIPKLNKVFKKIGVRQRVGITHFLRLMSSEYTTIEVGEGSILFRRNPSSEGYWSLAKFAAESRAPSSDITRSKTGVANWDEFMRKYGSEDKLEKYIIRDLTYRSPIIQDLSSLDGEFSISFLKEVYAMKKELETKHKRTGRSFDELLSQ